MCSAVAPNFPEDIHFDRNGQSVINDSRTEVQLHEEKVHYHRSAWSSRESNKMYRK